MAAPGQAGGTFRCSSGLLTARNDGAGDLGVACRGVELLVPEQHLDHPDVDLLLQEMGGEAVPECLQGDALVDAGRLPGAMEGAP